MKFSVTVGRRGVFDCQSCDDSLKEERGLCPFLSQQKPATRPVLLSDTGDQEKDEMKCCPRGVQLRNEGLIETLKSFFDIKHIGVFDFFGEGLVFLPPRISDVFSQLSSIENQFEQEILFTRRMMDQEA